jgi:sugar lactone lactonase YvrE
MKSSVLNTALALTVLTASASAQPNPYRTVENWAQLPEGTKWGQVISVDPDSHGNIWVFHRGETPLLEFAPSGKFIKGLGKDMFVQPHGLYIDKDDNVWVSDGRGKDGKGQQVFKLSPDGKVLMTLGTAGVAGTTPTTFNAPSDIVVAPNGDIFIADGHGQATNARIVKFDKTGKFIKAWGTKGSGPGQFDIPHTIAIDSQGRLFVGDRNNNRIQIFDQEGNFITEWKQFGRPSGIFIAKDDTIYVVDSESNKARNPGWTRGIRIGNTKDGKVVAMIPDTEPAPDTSTVIGQEGVTADQNGNVYGADVGHMRLMKYVKASTSFKAEKLPVTADNYPFGAANHTRVPEDLSKIGYVEEEFLVSGTANVYDWPEPGPAVVRTPDVPYTTRVLIRRPADRAKFSGTVAVEMQNPSNLFDLNLGWTLHHKEFARNGDVWVGITAKPVSIAAVKTFNPARYADLSWPNPLPLDDPRNCAKVAADSQRTTENGLIWDMFSQVGLWLKSPDKSNPLTYGGSATAAQHLIGWGYSQTGGYLYTYINAIHPLHKGIFDAYLVATSSGPSPINQCAAPIPAGDSRRVIKDAGVPVVRIMTLSDYLTSIPARLPDSDTAPNLTRNYEIAGAAHATPDELIFAATPADIEKTGHPVPPMSCNEGPRSRFPNGPAFNAIFRNLDTWVRTGTPAPKAEQIKVENGKPVLDATGNVVGGVRSPFVDVPTSDWYGNSTGESFCRIAGHEVPFDAAKLHQLYPTGKAYEQAVKADVAKLVQERFLLKADGDELISTLHLPKAN